MLYRFSAFNSLNLDAIANNSFFFSQRDQVNDPLDCNPPITCPTYSEFRARLKKLIGELKNCSDEFIDLFQHEEVIEATYSPFKDIAQLKGLLTQQADNVGILCFTKEYDNPLMWSHYADGHRGFCIGYDIKYDDTHMWNEINLFDNECVLLRGVEYSSKPIDVVIMYMALLHFMLRNARNSSGFLEFDSAYKVLGFENISKVIFSHLSVFFLSHKHTSWNYENEVRLLAMPRDNRSNSGLKQSKSSLLRKVYFGAKMPMSQKKTLTKLLSSNGTAFYEGYFSNEKLDVSFRSVHYD